MLWPWEQQQKFFYRPDASLGGSIGILTCLTVRANAYICFLIWGLLLFSLQMLLSEKAEALQEEVEELLKVPTDIPGPPDQLS